MEYKKKILETSKNYNIDIDFESLLNPEIEEQKTCHHCISNERGYCLMFGGRILNEVKSLCYKKESGQNENKKD